MNTRKPSPADTLPEQPVAQDGYGPRNEEERRIYELIKEALDADKWTEYDSVDALMDDLFKKADTNKG